MQCFRPKCHVLPSCLSGLQALWLNLYSLFFTPGRSLKRNTRYGPRRYGMSCHASIKSLASFRERPCIPTEASVSYRTLRYSCDQAVTNLVAGLICRDGRLVILPEILGRAHTPYPVSRFCFRFFHEPQNLQPWFCTCPETLLKILHTCRIDGNAFRYACNMLYLHAKGHSSIVPAKKSMSYLDVRTNLDCDYNYHYYHIIIIIIAIKHHQQLQQHSVYNTPLMLAGNHVQLRRMGLHACQGSHRWLCSGSIRRLRVRQGMRPWHVCLSWVYSFVFINACMRIYSPTHEPCTHVCIYTYTRMYSTHTYIIHAYIHTYIHTYIHIYMHRRIHTCIHSHIHAYIHTYLHAHINIYIHTYVIHTYINTNAGGCGHPARSKISPEVGGMASLFPACVHMSMCIFAYMRACV